MSRTLKILAGLALVLIGVGALFSPGAVLGKPLAELDHEWSVSGGELRELQILSDHQVNVVFQESSDGSQSVSVKGQVQDEVAKAISGTRLEAGRLVVDLRQPRSFLPMFRLGFLWSTPEVTVKLAPGYELDHLSVRMDAGSMNIRSVAAKTAEFTSDSGNLKLSDVTGSQIKIKADSGIIDLQNVAADLLDVRMDSGKIAGSGVRADTTIRLDSGVVRLDGVTGTTNIQADSGDIRLIKEDTSDADIRVDSGNVHIRLPAAFAGSLDLHTDSGRIRAPKAKNETQDRIRVHTDSGNIEIDQAE